MLLDKGGKYGFPEANLLGHSPALPSMQALQLSLLHDANLIVAPSFSLLGVEDCIEFYHTDHDPISPPGALSSVKGVRWLAAGHVLGMYYRASNFLAQPFLGQHFQRKLTDLASGAPFTDKGPLPMAPHPMAFWR